MAKAKKTKKPARKRPATQEELALAVRGVLSDVEIELALAFVRKTPSIREVERKFELPETSAWRILKKARVAEFIERLGVARLALQESIAEQEAELKAERLAFGRDRIQDIIASAPHEKAGWSGNLKAIEMNEKIYGDQPDSPGQQIASQIAQQVHVHVGSGEGESVYRPAWIRARRGISDPISEAIDKEYGGIDSLPSQATTFERPVSHGSAHAEPALETEDPSTVEGA